MSRWASAAVSERIVASLQRACWHRVEESDRPGVALVVEDSRAARPIGVGRGYVLGEQRLVDPGAGVGDPWLAARAFPLGLVIAGKRAEPVDMSEDDTVGVEAEALGHVDERRDARDVRLQAQER